MSDKCVVVYEQGQKCPCGKSSVGRYRVEGPGILSPSAYDQEAAQHLATAYNEIATIRAEVTRLRKENAALVLSTGEHITVRSEQHAELTRLRERDAENEKLHASCLSFSNASAAWGKERDELKKQVQATATELRGLRPLQQSVETWMNRALAAESEATRLKAEQQRFIEKDAAVVAENTRLREREKALVEALTLARRAFKAFLAEKCGLDWSGETADIIDAALTPSEPPVEPKI